MQFFGRSETSPGDSSTPGLDLNLDVKNYIEGLILAHLFMQILLEQGLQKYGKKGEESVMKELGSLVSFLTTRVKCPDTDDWGKLKRVMKYLNGTQQLKLRSKINGV